MLCAPFRLAVFIASQLCPPSPMGLLAVVPLSFPPWAYRHHSHLQTILILSLKCTTHRSPKPGISFSLEASQPPAKRAQPPLQPCIRNYKSINTLSFLIRPRSECDPNPRRDMTSDPSILCYCALPGVLLRPNRPTEMGRGKQKQF